jgi:hypothetical protein
MDALDNFGNIVKISQRAITGTKEDFVTLDIEMHDSVHFQLSSQSRSSTLTIFLDNKAQIKEIIGLAHEIIKE